jgi:hypothetical protein
VQRDDEVMRIHRRKALADGQDHPGQDHSEARATRAFAQIGQQDGEETLQCGHLSGALRRRRAARYRRLPALA